MYCQNNKESYIVETWRNWNKYKKLIQRCSLSHLDFLHSQFSYTEISQNSQENICARASFLIKLQAWGEIFRNFKNTAFLKNTSGGRFCTWDSLDDMMSYCLNFLLLLWNINSFIC